MADRSGLFSLRGFLYQMVVYCYEVLKKINSENIITYEGEDDVEVENDSSTLVLLSNELIQVKSGNVTNTIAHGVIANWLNRDDLDSKSLSLFIESGNIKFDDEYFEAFYSYISNKDRLMKSGSKTTRCYNKFGGNKTQLKNAFDKYIKKVNCIIYSWDDLEKAMIDLVKNNFSISNQLKAEYFIHNFCERIINEIFDSLKDTESYVCHIATYNQIIRDISRDILENKYRFNFDKYEDETYETLKSKVDSRFLDEIKKVSRTKNFLLFNLKAELEYELFRDLIEPSQEKKLDETENTAYNNRMYQDGNADNTDSNKLYQNTINMPLNSDLLFDNTDSKIGCYNFLTTSKCNPKRQISWEVNNEEVD